MNSGSVHANPGLKPNMVSGRASSTSFIRAVLVRELHTLQASVGTDRGR